MATGLICKIQGGLNKKRGKNKIPLGGRRILGRIYLFLPGLQTAHSLITNTPTPRYGSGPSASQLIGPV